MTFEENVSFEISAIRNKRLNSYEKLSILFFSPVITV